MEQHCDGLLLLGCWRSRVQKEDEAKPIWKRGGGSLQKEKLEGLYMGRHLFFSFFIIIIIALSKKGDFTLQAWLMLLMGVSC